MPETINVNQNIDEDVWTKGRVSKVASWFDNRLYYDTYHSQDEVDLSVTSAEVRNPNVKRKI